jgi:hypothetical protein
VPIGAAKKFLERMRKKNKKGCFAWDSLEGSWRVQDARLVPGKAYLLACSEGGYAESLGWTGNPKDRPAEFSSERGIAQDDDAADRLTYSSRDFVTLATHSVETKQMCQQLREQLAYELPLRYPCRVPACNGHSFWAARLAGRISDGYGRTDLSAQ